MRYRNRNTGEQRVTVDGSRLDRRVAADPDWEPMPAEPVAIFTKTEVEAMTADDEDAA